MSNILSLNNACCGCNDSSGGGDKYYQMIFTGALTFTILGATHLIGRIPDIKIYKANGLDYTDQILAHEEINSTFDVTVTFKQPQTGIIILT